MTALRLLLLTVIGFAVAAPAAAQTNPYTWQPITSSTWNTAGNWRNGSAVAEVPPSNAATQLVFNASGTQSYTTTNDIGAFTLNRLTVNNTGTGTVTVAGTGALTLAGTTPTLDITGTTLFTGLFAGSGSITKTGTGTFIHDSNNSGFTGTLTIDGGTFVNRATTNATTNFNPTSIVVNNGGTYQFGENTTGDPNLPNSTYITINSGGTVVWQEGETTGGIHLNGGTLNLQQGSITTATNTGSANVMNWTAGTVTGTGASAFAVAGALPISKTTSGTVTIQGNASVTTTGLFTIADGTVSHVAAGNLGTSNIALGGATAGSTVGTFEYQGASVARAGTFAVNAGGGAIAVTNANSTLTLSGALSGAGNLSKTGAGTLALTGALGGTGTTTVATGTLRVNPVTAAGGFAVSNAATLAVNSGTGAASFGTAALALASGSTVRFELNTASLPTAPLVNVTGTDALTSAGATLSLTNQQAFANGTYTLLGYTGAAINSGYTLALPGRTAGSLDYSTANQINAIITGTDTIKWGGQVDGVWDTGTAANVGGTNNWRLASNNNGTNFIATDTVTFDDTASGNFAVSIGATVNPASVTVNNTANDYTFSGAGGIGGTGGLTKSGTGRLTVATANTYSGGTTVNAGTVQVGNGGTTGDLGTGTVALTGGALEFDRSAAHTFANAITVSAAGGLRNAGTGAVTVSSALALGANNFGLGGTGNTVVSGAIAGTGTITKTGTGTVTLLANNAFTGTFVIDGGTVLLNDTGLGGDLNAAAINVNSGGTFQFGDTGGSNPDLPANTVITINTGGVARFTIGEDYGGFNLRGGAYNSNVNSNLGLTSTLESGTIGNIGGVNGSFAGAGLVQKTTAGTVTITGVALNGTGGLNIDEGVLSTDSAIGGSGTIRFGNVAAATLEYRGANATVSRAVTLDSAGGTFGVTTAATTYTLSGVLSGPGALTKTGAGTLALSGANTYTGGTTVSAGTLLVAGNSVAANGAVLVQNGATLGGTGTIGGGTTVESGGTIRGGTATAAGTLTTGNVTVNSGGILAANLAASGTSSTLAVGGNTLNFASGSKVALTAVSGFDGTAGAFTLATLTDGNTLQLDGVGNRADGFSFGKYVEGTGATGAVVIDTTNLGFTLAAGDTFEVNRVGNNLVLSFTPVPEPATVLAVGAAGLGALSWLRRRRKAANA